MSTGFVLSKKVSARDLFDDRLENCGIREHVCTDTNERNRCLTDGRNYLWVSIADDGLVAELTRYGANAPSNILRAIAETFDTDIFSEHEPQFWGYSTREEWDAAMEDVARRNRDEFYIDVCAYVRGEVHKITPGTIGEIEAKIAKSLVEKDAALLQPENKDRLMAEMETIYHRDHSTVVTLGPEDLALSKMLGTHEDDLPQA
ncbi:hypothetical protein [Bradyrhizobium liaoningense]|uniref:hypothetical protein n=1 Tax=Bradyrhizobium liaoningense TaxID=43992 RepID=UPI001BA99EC8|nr:hypothetical protein [Bradyrhizobium liaoningense]MBR0719389.1 hypothetical protein [Bradyrhizobium liaoningense]